MSDEHRRSDDITLREYIDALAQARWQAHHDEHQALSAAIDTARRSLEGRLEALNQLRSEVIQDRGEFMRRDSFDVYRDATEKRFGVLERAKAALPVAGLALLVSGIATIISAVKK